MSRVSAWTVYNYSRRSRRRGRDPRHTNTTHTHTNAMLVFSSHLEVSSITYGKWWVRQNLDTRNRLSI
jgi:hypothetical protein